MVDNPYISSYYGYHKGFEIFIDLQKFWQNPVAKIRKVIVRMAPGKGAERSSNLLLIPERMAKLLLYRNALPESIITQTSILIALIDLLQYKLLDIDPERMPVTRGEELIEILSHVLPRITRAPYKPLFLWIHIMDLHDNGFGSYAPPIKNRLNNLVSLYRMISLLREIELRTRTTRLMNSDVLALLKQLRSLALRYTDLVLYKLFELLGQLGLNFDNTLFIVTSDHGEAFLEHGVLYHYDPALYNEHIKVPLYISMQEVVDANNLGRSITSHYDIARMILRAILGDVKLALRLLKLPFLAHYYFKIPGIFAEYWHRESMSFAYIEDKVKTIVTLQGRHIKRVELYNITKDPLEKQNIAHDNLDLVREHLKILAKHVLLEGHVTLSKAIFDYIAGVKC